MKCNNCGNILEKGTMFCHLCGSGDLVPINNEQTDNQIINNANADLENNNIVITQENINMENNFNQSNNVDTNKANNKKTIGWIFISISLISILILIILISKTSINLIIKGNYNGTTSEEFGKYMEENDYVITDLSDTNSSYSYADTYYVARKNNNNYSIIYIYSKDDDFMIYNSYENIKNNIIKSEDDFVSNKIDVSNNNFSKYSVDTNNEYKVVAKTENTIMYSTVPIGYKDRIDKIFDDLGYSYSSYKDIDNIYIYLALIVLIMELLFIVSLWKIFKKAGRKGIYSIIPIYNIYYFTKLITGNGWLFLITLIPLINIIFIYYLLFKLAKLFGKKILFIIGLMLLPIVFIPILAFDDSIYYGI